MNTKINSAINGMNVIEFHYNGHRRVVEPHAYGVTSKGNEVLRGYQTEGTSDSGIVPDWRLFTVTKIEGLYILEETFTNPRFGYKRNDSVMSNIFSQL